MSLWNFIKKKILRSSDETVIEEQNIKPVVLIEPRAINNYVVSLCEQMIETTKELDEIRKEYDEVTAYLNDITIVEGLEGELAGSAPVGICLFGNSQVQQGWPFIQPTDPQELEIIGEQAKQNNNHVLAIATNAIGVVQADNLAEAISKVLTIIDEARKL
jgi:hypothetical protein